MTNLENQYKKSLDPVVSKGDWGEKSFKCHVRFVFCSAMFGAVIKSENNLSNKMGISPWI